MSLSVLHILPSLALGGAERITIELAALQRSENLEVQILSLGSADDFLVKEAEAVGIPVHVVDSGSSRYSRYQKIHQLCRGFDVLHLHSPRGLRFLLPVILLLNSKKIIYTRHGLDPLNSLKFKFVHIIARFYIDYVTFVTEFGYDVFTQNHRWNPQKLKVITNGVEVPDIYEREIGSTVRFGSVGRMVALKGQSFLLDAVKEMRQLSENHDINSFALNFYGTGPVEADLKAQAKELGIVDTVHFYGEVSDIEEIYNNVDVLVVTSRSEGLSMVIIEAMARSIPVIATSVGGNTTLVLDGKTGIVIPYGSTEAIVSAMKKFLDAGFIRNMGIASRQHIVENFSLQGTHEAFLECYTG